MKLLREERGIAILYTTLLIPTFLVLLAFVVELGSLRMMRARLLSAADLAATSAVTEQDRDALAATGRYEVAAAAADVARALLAQELRPLAPLLAPGHSADEVASGADVVVLRAGAYDLASARRYEAPTVRIAFTAPVRTPLLVLGGLRDVTELRILAAASAR